MSTGKHEHLEDRLERLENRLLKIEEALGIQSDENSESAQDFEKKTSLQEFFKNENASDQQKPFQKYLKSDFWIGKVGILMLIIGVSFFFNYAISEGWMGQTAQLISGVVFGVVLHVLGNKVQSNVLGLRSVLLGGSIVTFYATLLAGVLLYQLFPVWLTILLAFAILIFASRTASKEQNSWIAGVAAVGALVVVVIFSERLSALAVVTSGWTVALLGVWFYKKFSWSRVMDISWFGSLFISSFLIAINTFSFNQSSIANVVTAVEVVTYWIIAIILPHLIDNRSQINEKKTGSLPLFTVLAYLVIPVSIIIVFNSIWDFSEIENALLFITIAAVHHGWGYYLYRKNREINQETELSFYSGQILFTGSIFILIDGPLFWIIFAGQGAFWIVYLKSSSFWWKLPGHLVMLFSALYIGWWFENVNVTKFMDAQSIGILVIIGIFTFVALKKNDIRDVYSLAVHLFFMGWLYKICALFEPHEMAATISWFLYVSLLITLGFWLDLKKLRTLSFITLLIVTAKLLFVDINNVSPIIRIVILIALGGILLGLSYRFGNAQREKVSEKTGNF